MDYICKAQTKTNTTTSLTSDRDPGVVFGAVQRGSVDLFNLWSLEASLSSGSDEPGLLGASVIFFALPTTQQYTVYSNTL